MAQTVRITTKSVVQAETVHDLFDAAVSDGHVCAAEIISLQQHLDLMLLTTSLADAEVNLGVNSIRGGVGTRHHKALVQDCERLEAQVIEMETAIWEEPQDAA